MDRPSIPGGIRRRRAHYRQPLTMPIHGAAYQGNLTEVQTLLEGDPLLLHAVDGMLGRSPLHFACAGGRTNVVSYLLDRGADVHVRDRYRATPLHIACNKGHAETVRLLLTRGAHMCAANCRGDTPLMEAVVSQDCGTVKTILAHACGCGCGCRCGCHANPSPVACVCWAMGDHPPHVRHTHALFGGGGSCGGGGGDNGSEAGGPAHPTPTMPRAPHTDVHPTHAHTRDVIDTGVCDATDTPAHARDVIDTAQIHQPTRGAINTRAHTRDVIINTDLCDPINRRNRQGWTALFSACYWEGGGDVAKLLLEAGADPTIPDGVGETIMDGAGAQQGCAPLVEGWQREYLLHRARRLRDTSATASQAQTRTSGM